MKKKQIKREKNIEIGRETGKKDKTVKVEIDLLPEIDEGGLCPPAEDVVPPVTEREEGVVVHLVIGIVGGEILQTIERKGGNLQRIVKGINPKITKKIKTRKRNRNLLKTCLWMKDSKIMKRCL